MNTRARCFCAAFLTSLFATAAVAESATYDEDRQELTIPLLVVGEDVYANAVVKLDGLDTSQFTQVGSACDATVNISTSRYGLIQSGMPLSQVTAIIGCESNNTLTIKKGTIATYYWATSDVDQWIGVNIFLKSKKVATKAQLEKNKNFGPGHREKCFYNSTGC